MTASERMKRGALKWDEMKTLGSTGYVTGISETLNTTNGKHLASLKYGKWSFEKKQDNRDHKLVQCLIYSSILSLLQ